MPIGFVPYAISHTLFGQLARRARIVAQRKIPKAIRPDEQAQRKHETGNSRRLINAPQERTRGKRRDERNRHDERQQHAHHATIDRHRVTSRFVERVEQFGNVVNLY